MSDPQPDTEATGFLRIMNTTLDAIAFACRILTGVAMVVLTVIFGWLVFGRYVLNATPTWVEQVSFLLVMTIAFLGAAVGVHENTHLSVNVLRNAVPAWMKTGLTVFNDVLLAGFGYLMLIYGAQLTSFKWGSMIPLINVPEGLRTLPLTIGGGLILLFSVGHLLRLFMSRDMRRDII